MKLLMLIHLVLKELFLTNFALPEITDCWIITGSEFKVAATSLLKPCHRACSCGYRMKKGS